MSYSSPKCIHTSVSLIGVTAVVLLMPRQAHAYLDAASGSMIIQAVITAVMGGLFIFRGQWRRLKSLFRSDRSPEETHGGTDEPQS